MKVAVLGGTGAFGSALAGRLVEAGLEVSIGSRDADRAAAAAAELGAARGAANAQAVDGVDHVVLSVLAAAALETVAELADPIGETAVLSVASEVRVVGGVAFPGDNPLSLAERAQELLRGPVVAGLHSLAAATLGGDEPPDEDAFVCGDDPDGKALALEVAGRICDGRALDAGPLASARALEGLTAVIVNLNKRYRAHAGIRVTGIR